MACLSCRVAELEALQQWLLYAGGRVSMKEFVPAWFTDCFTIIFLSKELISQVSSCRQPPFLTFAEEKEVGLHVYLNNGLCAKLS